MPRQGRSRFARSYQSSSARESVDVSEIVEDAAAVTEHNLNLSHIKVRLELAADLPSNVIRVAESGVRGPQDVVNYARSGADTVLVGEALVTSGDPRAAIRDMVAVGQHPSLDAMER